MHSFLMIVAEYSYTNIGPIFFLYCLIPFALEVCVGIMVFKNSRIFKSIHNKRDQRVQLLKSEIDKRNELKDKLEKKKRDQSAVAAEEEKE